MNVARQALMLVLAAAVLAVVAFFAGRASVQATPPQSLRLGGYQFIDPLLACNINNSNVFAENKALAAEIQSIVDSHVRSGDISKSSVYYSSLDSRTWASVNGDQQFYPSSLGKIPLLVAYYQESESNPSILQKEIFFPAGGTDLNEMQDIPPLSAIEPGHAYTIEQLLEYMIKYSDNNATALLDANIDADTLDRVYDDLDIPTEEDVTLTNADFMTAHQISTLFRVLYNATYLSRDDSEKALKLLSETSFTQGIVAGVGSSTVVSHKLGLVGIAPNNVTTEHELHDCGIVYASDPYLLCVMTRGSAPLPTLEGIIAQISKVVYNQAQ